MIDETAIRTALEAVLGETFGIHPVSRVGEHFDPTGAPFLRTLLFRTNNTKVSNAYTRATGMFSVFCLVPAGDGVKAAEDIAASVIAAFMPHDRLLGDLVRMVEAGIVSDNFSPGNVGGDSYIAATAQIDWQVDQIGG